MNNALFVFYLSAVLPFGKIIGETSKMYTGIRHFNLATVHALSKSA